MSWLLICTWCGACVGIIRKKSLIIISHQNGQGIKSQFLWYGFISSQAL